MQHKKNTFQVWVNIIKRKVVDNMLKKQKPFFINIGNYRDTSMYARQLFAHFGPVKFWSRDWAPPNSLSIKHW